MMAVARLLLQEALVQGGADRRIERCKPKKAHRRKGRREVVLAHSGFLHASSVGVTAWLKALPGC